MADELSVQGSLSFAKEGVTEPVGVSRSVGMSVPLTQFDVAGSNYVSNVLSVGTSATVIPLGSVSAPHWAFFQNLDATNYLSIRNGSGGADLIKLLPYEFALVPLPETAVPYGVAHTAACLLNYLIVAL